MPTAHTAGGGLQKINSDPGCTPMRSDGTGGGRRNQNASGHGAGERKGKGRRRDVPRGAERRSPPRHTLSPPRRLPHAPPSLASIAIPQDGNWPAGRKFLGGRTDVPHQWKRRACGSRGTCSGSGRYPVVGRLPHAVVRSERQREGKQWMRSCGGGCMDAAGGARRAEGLGEWYAAYRPSGRACAWATGVPACRSPPDCAACSS